MKRELMSVLLGAALLVPPSAVDAQRGRGGDRGPRVERLEPITVSGRVAVGRRVAVAGRVAGCPAPAHAPAVGCRRRAAARVVYRSPVTYRPYRSPRVQVYAEWIRVPARFTVGHRFDRALNPGQLKKVIGHRTVDRIHDLGHRAGLRGSARGHWIDSRRHGLVLVVTMDGVDVAEFIDYDRDGWFDDSFLFRLDRGGYWTGW